MKLGLVVVGLVVGVCSGLRLRSGQAREPSAKRTQAPITNDEESQAIEVQIGNSDLASLYKNAYTSEDQASASTYEQWLRKQKQLSMMTKTRKQGPSGDGSGSDDGTCSCTVPWPCWTGESGDAGCSGTGWSSDYPTDDSVIIFCGDLELSQPPPAVFTPCLNGVLYRPTPEDFCNDCVHEVEALAEGTDAEVRTVDGGGEGCGPNYPHGDCADVGTPCVFPFFYDSPTNEDYSYYYSCITTDSSTGQPWCYTDGTSDGGSTLWGYCPSKQSGTGPCNDACVNPSASAETECQSEGFDNCVEFCAIDIVLNTQELKHEFAENEIVSICAYNPVILTTSNLYTDYYSYYYEWDPEYEAMEAYICADPLCDEEDFDCEAEGYPPTYESYFPCDYEFVSEEDYHFTNYYSESDYIWAPAAGSASSFAFTDIPCTAHEIKEMYFSWYGLWDDDWSRTYPYYGFKTLAEAELQIAIMAKQNAQMFCHCRKNAKLCSHKPTCLWFAANSTLFINTDSAVHKTMVPVCREACAARVGERMYEFYPPAAWNATPEDRNMTSWEYESDGEDGAQAGHDYFRGGYTDKGVWDQDVAASRKICEAKKMSSGKTCDWCLVPDRYGGMIGCWPGGYCRCMRFNLNETNCIAADCQWGLVVDHHSEVVNSRDSKGMLYRRSVQSQADLAADAQNEGGKKIEGNYTVPGCYSEEEVMHYALETCASAGYEKQSPACKRIQTYFELPSVEAAWVFLDESTCENKEWVVYEQIDKDGDGKNDIDRWCFPRPLKMIVKKIQEGAVKTLEKWGFLDDLIKSMNDFSKGFGTKTAKTETKTTGAATATA